MKKVNKLIVLLLVAALSFILGFVGLTTVKAEEKTTMIYQKKMLY